MIYEKPLTRVFFASLCVRICCCSTAASFSPPWPWWWSTTPRHVVRKWLPWPSRRSWLGWTANSRTRCSSLSTPGWMRRRLFLLPAPTIPGLTSVCSCLKSESSAPRPASRDSALRFAACLWRWRRRTSPPVWTACCPCWSERRAPTTSKT